MSKTKPFQLTPKLINLALFYVPVVAILVVASLQTKVPTKLLVRDIFSLGNIPVYAGFISNLGIFALCCAASICLFTFCLIRPTSPKAKQIRYFLGGCGLISAWLMLDDFFMLHESQIPDNFGIPEEGVLIALAIGVMFHIIYHRHIILKSTNFWILGSAFLFFGLSLITDALYPDANLEGFDLYLLIEEGGKFLGIMTWCLYLCLTCYQQVILSKERGLSLIPETEIES